MSFKTMVLTYLAALLILAAAILTKAVHSAETPTPEQALAMCSADRDVANQFAVQQNKARNALEIELARERALTATLKEKLKELTDTKPQKGESK